MSNAHSKHNFATFCTRLAHPETSPLLIQMHLRVNCSIIHAAASAKVESQYGRSGLRPSLVQGLRPRNAPLQNHPSPPSHSFPTEVPDPAPLSKPAPQPNAINPHQSPSRPPANPPANPSTRPNHSPSRKSPKSQFRQIPPIPPPTPARAQITVHHENPPNHSSDKSRQSPRRPPHARKSQFRQIPPNHSSDQANCIKNRDIIALCRNTNRHCLERFVIKHDSGWLEI